MQYYNCVPYESLEREHRLQQTNIYTSFVILNFPTNHTMNLADAYIVSAVRTPIGNLIFLYINLKD